MITPLLWFFFIPLYVRLQVSSGYTYLRQRFNATVQRVGSLLYCGYALGWMGAMLYAIALTLKSVMHLNDAQYVLTLIGLGVFATAYTAVGGLRAVIWTDVLQAITLGAAVVVVLLLAVFGIADGWSGLWRIGQENGRWTMIHLQPNPFAVENFTAANSVYTAFAFALFMYLPLRHAHLCHVSFVWSHRTWTRRPDRPGCAATATGVRLLQGIHIRAIV